MKKLLLIAAGVAAFLFAQERVDEATTARIRSEEAEHSQLMRTLHMLTDRYGPRVTGTPGHEAAAKWAVEQFTKWGFEWTYEGASPQQLALAILYDHLGNKDRAIQLSEPFMKRVVADLDNDWMLTSDDVDKAIHAIG